MATGLLSPVHVVLLLVVVLMLFGAKRLPEMGRSLGTGLRGFKDSLEGIAQEDKPRLAAANHVADPATTTQAASPAQELESVSDQAAPGPRA
jgi:sec-independent protein translocase protein TatA